jgi:hypothetical protein
MASTINGTSTGNGGLITQGDDSGILNIQTNETTAITVDASQNVGIGGTPSYKLQVTATATSDGAYITNSSADGTTLYLNNSSASGRQFRLISTGSGNGPGAGTLGIFDGTANAYRAVIDSSGNLLVGTTSLTFGERLSVKSAGTSSASDGVLISNSAGTTLFRVRSDGAFQTGAAAVSPYNNTTGSAANTFVNTDGTLLRSTSSLKYKKDIADATHGLTDLLKLRSVTYKGKNEADGEKTFGGLIAEEVHDVGLTEFVHYSTDGSPDALNYGNMVALCVKAIQELKAINDTQDETITALTARIVAIESKP